jgi:hypothetical protein
MNVVVFDIETANFFTDPEVGWHNFSALRLSALGVYSYESDSYECFMGEELPRGLEFLESADLLVGFGISRYDIPVLNHAGRELLGRGLDLFSKNRVDLLDEIEFVTGRRISLNRLSEANLGEGKLAHDGRHAAEMFSRGALEELKKYCLKDVELTKRLYDKYRNDKHFLIPQRQGEPRRVEFSGLAGTLT